jgi:NAD-dependent SIR2 family protein deacetylase
LVLGSSLSVMSGLRFVHRARHAQIPVAIVNRGETRGDPLADMKVDAALGEVLSTLAGAPQ